MTILDIIVTAWVPVGLLVAISLVLWDRRKTRIRYGVLEPWEPFFLTTFTVTCSILWPFVLIGYYFMDRNSDIPNA